MIHMSCHKVENTTNGEITYFCKMSDSFLTYGVDSERIATMMNSYIDTEEIKLFIMLLDASIEDLKTTYSCEYISQMVSESDWNDFLSDDNRWSITEKNNDEHLLIIKCTIQNASACITRGFGFESVITV